MINDIANINVRPFTSLNCTLFYTRTPYWPTLRAEHESSTLLVSKPATGHDTEPVQSLSNPNARKDTATSSSHLLLGLLSSLTLGVCILLRV
jgi:hypothetical protein